MVDIFLHKYNSFDPLNAYTAPQRLRSAKGLKMNIELINQIETAWNYGKNEVLNQLVSKIKEGFKNKEKFGFILAPSNTELFYNDMLTVIKTEFTEGVDFSDCFQKVGEKNAANIKTELNNDELRKRYDLNIYCFLSKHNDDIKHIILIDDLYSIHI
jgi:hypothetical protein